MFAESLAELAESALGTRPCRAYCLQRESGVKGSGYCIGIATVVCGQCQGFAVEKMLA